MTSCVRSMSPSATAAIIRNCFLLTSNEQPSLLKVQHDPSGQAEIILGPAEEAGLQEISLNAPAD